MTEQMMDNKNQETMQMKLDVTVHPIEPKGNLLGFASVKINDCFVVKDFRILKSDKGLFVGMPNKPDKSSETGYRDTAKPITGDFRKQLFGAILGAYSAEIDRSQTVSKAQERPSVMQQLKAGTEQATKENAARLPREKPANAVER